MEFIGLEFSNLQAFFINFPLLLLAVSDYIIGDK